MASGRDSTSPHVSPFWGNTHGTGKREGRAPGWGKCAPLLSLLLSFGSQFPLKTQFCVFPLLPFEEKSAAGCLLCSAKRSYELFFQKNKGKKRDITKKRCFWGKEGQQKKRLAFSPQKEATHTLLHQSDLSLISQSLSLFGRKDSQSGEEKKK